MKLAHSKGYHHLWWMKSVAVGVVVCLVVLSLPPCDAATVDMNLFRRMQFTDHAQNPPHAVYRSLTVETGPVNLPWLNAIVEDVLWLFIGEKHLPDGYMKSSERGLEIGPKAKRSEWGDLLKEYWLAFLFVGLLGTLVVLMPIIGLSICICRCNGACLGKRRRWAIERMHRVVYAGLLTLLAVGIFYGAFVGFITTSRMQHGLDGFTTSVLDSKADIRTFMAATGEQVKHVLVTEYQELTAQLELILGNTFSIILNELEQQSMALSFRHLTDFTNNLPDVKQKLRRMQTIVDVLHIYRTEFTESLRDTKRYLVPVLSRCNYKACKDVLKAYEVRNLDYNVIDYNQLPDIKASIASAEQLIDAEMASTGSRGRNVYVEQLDEMRRSIDQVLPHIIDSMNKTGLKIERVARRINMELDQMGFVLRNNTGKMVRVMYNFLNEYRTTITGGAFFVLVVLFTLPCLMLISVMCGLWPPRTEYCCTKGQGARMLVIILTIIFLTISAIIAIALVHFVLGIFMYRGVCVPLRDRSNDLFILLDNSIDLNRELYSPLSTLPPLRLSHMISSCRESNTIFQVLHLRNRSGIYRMDFPAAQKVHLALQDLASSVDFDSSHLKILTGTDKERLAILGASALNTFDGQPFLDVLNASTTKFPLGELARQLRSIAKQLVVDDQRDVQMILRAEADRLDDYLQHLVAPMQHQEEQLRDVVTDLDWGMHYKERPFRESMELLVTETTYAEVFLREKGLDLVRAVAKNVSEFCGDEINRYLAMARNAVERDIGSCQPLARVFDASVISICDRIVDPLNGFWIAVMWCILLLMLTLLVAIRLANLYRHHDRDQFDDVEEEDENADEEEVTEEGDEDDDEEDEEEME